MKKAARLLLFEDLYACDTHPLDSDTYQIWEWLTPTSLPTLVGDFEKGSPHFPYGNLVEPDE